MMTPVATPPLRNSPRGSGPSSSSSSKFVISDTRRAAQHHQQKTTTTTVMNPLLCMNNGLEDELLLAHQPPSALVPVWLPRPPHSDVEGTSSPPSTSPSSRGLPGAGSAVSLIRRRTSSSSSDSFSSLNSSSTTTRSSLTQFGLSASALCILLLPRTDVDMQEQKREAALRRKENHSKWLAAKKPGNLVQQDIVWMLKALILEAERFQSDCGQSYLKKAVVTRAMVALGDECPPKYYQRTKASDILFNDIDCVMELPEEGLPPGGCVAFAVREVQSFPLWLPAKAGRKNTND